MRLLYWALVLGLLVAALAACGGGGEKSGKKLTLGSVVFNNHGTKAVKGKSNVEFEVDSFYFEPTFLRGDPGQKLTLQVKNDSKDLHNVSLAGQSVSTDIPAKGKATVTLTFPASGVAFFFCKYHTSQGMNGELLTGSAAPQAPASGAASPAAAPTGPAPAPTQAPGAPRY